VGRGAVIAPGAPDRLLRLAEPPDDRWEVSVGGSRLERAPGGEPGTQFAVGAAVGPLDYRLREGTAWWLWVQLAGLLLLAIMAAPSVRRRSEGSGPRRAAGGAS